MNNPVFFQSAGDERGTPQGTFDALNAEFHFNLDVAARAENAKCELFYGPGSTLAEDALTTDWGGVGFTVWMNPPYSIAGRFIKKAREEADKGTTVVMLLPVRSDTAWWQNYIWDKDAWVEQTVPSKVDPESTRVITNKDGDWRPGVRGRLLPGRLEFELKVSDDLRAWIAEQHNAALAEGPKFDDRAWMKSMVDITGLPKMAVERILQDVPDKDLLDSAPFPSCVVIFEPVLGGSVQ
jgi:phage N-6-adenine-methyltransferase